DPAAVARLTADDPELAALTTVGVARCGLGRRVWRALLVAFASLQGGRQVRGVEVKLAFAGVAWIFVSILFRPDKLREFQCVDLVLECHEDKVTSSVLVEITPECKLTRRWLSLDQP